MNRCGLTMTLMRRTMVVQMKEGSYIDNDGLMKQHLDEKIKNIDMREKGFSSFNPATTLSKSPFFIEIQRTNPPSHFVLPKFELFNVTTYPTIHVFHYRQAMETTNIPHTKRKLMMCKAFTSNLIRPMLLWFNHLQSHYINSLQKLVQLFVRLYFTSITHQKKAKDLFSIMQQKDETICST